MRDFLYEIHQTQAARRHMPPLAYADFHARLPATYDTDLSALVLPAADVTLRATIELEPKFNLGRLCITSGAAHAVPPLEAVQAFARHAVGDWGDLDAMDWKANDTALREGGRLFSVYATSTGQKFYVITESDRNHTNVELNICHIMLSLQKC